MVNVLNDFNLVDYLSFVFTTDFRNNYFRFYVSKYHDYGPRFKRFNDAIDSLIGFYHSIEVSINVLPDFKQADKTLIRDTVSVAVSDLERMRDNVPSDIYSLFGALS